MLVNGFDNTVLGPGALALIEMRGVDRRYRSHTGEVVALENVDMEVERGEFVAVVGPSD